MSRRSIRDLTGQLREISRELEQLTFEPSAEGLVEAQERRDQLEAEARNTWHELETAVDALRRRSIH